MIIKLAFMVIFFGGMGIGLLIFCWGLTYLSVLGYTYIFDKIAWQRARPDLVLHLITCLCAMLLGILWVRFVTAGFLKIGVRI